MGFVCCLIPFSGNDQEAIALQALCLSSVEFEHKLGCMWGEAGPDMDRVPDSAVTHGIVQNEKHTGCFYLHRQNGSPSSCAFFEITGTLKNE